MNLRIFHHQYLQTEIYSMKLSKILLVILFISLLSSPSWSETSDDLVYRDGTYYPKFSDAPFTGEVTGRHQGSVKNGKREGAWVRYLGNGQLESKGNYKNGEREGVWVRYWGNGQLHYKGNFKNGEIEGAWVKYYANGQLELKGNYKNGKKDGAWEDYYDNGQLSYKGNFKNGKREGDGVAYSYIGTIDKTRTGTFKNDVKISD